MRTRHLDERLFCVQKTGNGGGGDTPRVRRPEKHVWTTAGATFRLGDEHEHWHQCQWWYGRDALATTSGA